MEAPRSPRNLQQPAVDLATDHKWHVFQLAPCSKIPYRRSNGWHDATGDSDRVWSLWHHRPAANIGVACRPSGLLVVDVDPRDGGDDQLADLERELEPLPTTPRAITPRGGEHYYFLHPELRGGTRLRGKLGPGIDLKSNGYVVAPPSFVRKLDDDGRRLYEGRYEWDVGPDDAPLAAVPQAFLDRMLELPPRRATRPPARRGLQRQDRIPARQYVRDLARVDVGRDGKARCPFHDDTTPSLHAYDDPDLGWYCYGCGRGGSIYDFAGLLLVGKSGHDLRRADYERVWRAVRAYYGLPLEEAE